MNNLMHNAAVLLTLEVSMTNTRRSCPTHNMTTEWIKLITTERQAAVSLVDECAGVVYFNARKEVQSLTIVSRSYVKNNRAK